MAAPLSPKTSSGDLHHPDGLLQLGAEAGVVVVLHRLKGVGHLGLSMADNSTEWHRPLSDRGGKSAAAHLLYIAAQELDEIRGVATDIG